MSTPEFRTSLHGVPYDDTVAARPPIQVRTASFRSQQDVQENNLDSTSTHNAVTLKSTANTNGHLGSADGQDVRRQIKPTSLPRTGSPSAHESQTSFNTNDRAPSSVTSAPSIPQIRVNSEDDQTTPRAEEGSKKWLSIKPTKQRTNSEKKDANHTPQAFQGIALDIPGGSWGDDLQTNNMSFSNRGSMFLDGRKVSPATSVPPRSLTRPTMATQRIPTSASVPDRLPPRMMSTDEEMLAEKVRLYYSHGTDANEMDRESEMANEMGTRWQNQLGTDAESIKTTSRAASTTDLSLQQSPSIAPSRPDNIPREEMELAGGLEDWQDINNADVDRYGFIVPKSPTTQNSSSGIKRSGTLQRVTTSLQVASDTPRRKRTIRRSSVEASGRPSTSRLTRTTSNQSLPRPSSSKSATVHRSFTLRSASNRLPGHKDRRLLDEAGDMFTLPPSLTAGALSRTDTMDSDRSSKSKSKVAPDSKATSAAARKKETEREEKWRKMARPIASTAKDPEHKGIGGGMLFSFPPPTDAKLMSRTWKGIPDTWRAPAWHYFLSLSARKYSGSLADDKLIKLFYEYQDINSPDDVQIDIDVPRTISSHIMFRRRYRGGQRLLFRVLHAMSLHWPETGYVQGMAALAATLLSYYEEEKAFIMLVRLWECRGLGKLYKDGFGGLMEALNDFENGWLGDGEVAKKLTDLNIFPTAYGTKWYLTLFNYSVPFPAQLRVWDVFMLLGDNTEAIPSPPTRPGTSIKTSTLDQASSQPKTPSPEDLPFGTTLDVLHATSAALIDGMRDILLGSDFENAMKVLTSWIPIRDEDLFMRVARTEWKMHRERRRKGK